MSLRCALGFHHVPKTIEDSNGSSSSPTMVHHTSASSNISLSSLDHLPEMTRVQSFTESENDSGSSRSASPSISCSNRSSPAHSQSPRSIFQQYWTSPTHQKADSITSDEENEELLARLSTLQLPMVDDADQDSNATGARIIHPANIRPPPLTSSSESDVGLQVTKPRTCSMDDTSLNYTLPPASPTRKRRQILPTPPAAVSSSLILPPRSHFQQETVLQDTRRKWSSTSALLKVRTPSQSCLRKSLRYTSKSCSAIDDVQAASERKKTTTTISEDTRSELKGHVSFYSQVSVYEFQVVKDQIQRSQKGWSNYFV